MKGELADELRVSIDGGGPRPSHSLFMIGANGSVRGKKEFEPSSLAAESDPLLGPHLEDYWSHRGLLGPLWRTIGLIGPFHLGRSVPTLSPYHGRLGREGTSAEQVSAHGLSAASRLLAALVLFPT